MTSCVMSDVCCVLSAVDCRMQPMVLSDVIQRGNWLWDVGCGIWGWGWAGNVWMLPILLPRMFFHPHHFISMLHY